MSFSKPGASAANNSSPVTGNLQNAVLVPKKVIQFNGERAIFRSDVLEKGVEDAGAMNDQLYVISVTGICRSGKSFLINLMIHYLDYYCQLGTDDGWEKSPQQITGIKWAKGQKQTVTQGMWMLIYPKLICGKRLVFLDCQGTGDGDLHTPTLDKMIMFYSLKLSDTTILNIRGNIELKDLDALGVCLLTRQGKQLPTGFKNLRFLIRDWPDDEEPQRLTEMARTTQSSDVKKAVNAILKACHTVHSTGLPHPGRRVSKSSASDGITLEDVDEDFVADCKLYFKTVLISEPSESTNKKGRDFVFDFELLGNDTVEKSTSLMEACVSGLVNDAYTDALHSLEGRGLNVLERHCNTEQEMRRTAGQAVAEVVNEYRADPRVVEYATEDTKRKDASGLQKITGELVEQAAHNLRAQTSEKKLREAKEEEANIRMELQRKQEELQKKQEELERKQEDLQRMQEELEDTREDAKGLNKMPAELVEKTASDFRVLTLDGKPKKTKEEEANIRMEQQRKQEEQQRKQEEQQRKQEELQRKQEELQRMREELEATSDRRLENIVKLQQDRGDARKKTVGLIREIDEGTDLEVQREMSLGARFYSGWKCLGNALVAGGGAVREIVTTTTQAAANVVNNASNCSIS